MIDPRYMTAVEWCNQMVQSLSTVMVAPKITHADEWRSWAERVVANPTIRQSQPPDPRFFDSWLEWAERFLSTTTDSYLSSPSNSSGLIWTNRGAVALAGGWGLVYLGGGNTLAMGNDGQTYRSGDGGHTWAHLGSAAGWVASQVDGPLVASGTTIIAANDGNIFRSTNGGVSFTSAANGINNAGGVIVGTDGAGNWVGVGNIAGPLSNVYGKSIDDGVTWSTAGNVTSIGGAAYPANVFWDAAGSQFVFFGLLGVGSTDLQTSTDGLTWSLTPFVPSPDSIGLLQSIGGSLYGCSLNANSIYVSNTVAGLANPASTITVSADTNGLSFLLQAGSVFFTIDFAGQVFNASAIAGPWALGNLNFPALDTAAAMVYDPVNHSVIALSVTAGQISTFP